jgi:2-polyprenyl-3-methyl-5-hydroxy-6-metoxy-1,4-benzoquinol methylase
MSEQKAKLTIRLTEPKTTVNRFDYLVHHYLFRDLKEAIHQYASGALLDIGCGNKPYRVWMVEKGCEVTGCDIEQSSEKLVDIICPATSIPLPDASFDTVFSSQVLEHVAEHGKMLDECYRLLKPGGYLIVSAPMFWEHHESPYDFFRFTRYGFNHLLTQRKFEVIQIKANGGKWALQGQTMLCNFNSFFIRHTGMVAKFFRFLYFALHIKAMVNIVYRWFDKIDFDDNNTLNFVVVARKPIVS